MPTIFLDRSAISLYDAQYKESTKAPISSSTISAVTRALRRFQQICASFHVPPANIRVVATEATREAQNSAEFRQKVRDATGWEVGLLGKADEGTIGAWGIASSLDEVQGLVMDLGGGSTQLSWLLSSGGQVTVEPNPISMPYGAAALTKRLEAATGDKKAIAAIRTEIAGRLNDAYASFLFPSSLKKQQKGGLALYLCGGGFRGFGYLLLAQSPIQPYPIPIINGFSTTGDHFRALAAIHTYGDVSSSSSSVVQDTFRVSARRAKQLPAVAFLIETLATTLPTISTVTFCQGGVREGCLYSTLPPAIRAQDPLEVATSPFAPASAAALKLVLEQALPPSAPAEIRLLLAPVTNMLVFGREMMKESRATVGLHVTTTGALAGVHGLSHRQRASLSLVLCARWGGEVHDSDLKRRLEDLVGDKMAYWARYLGAVAAIAGAVYPAGRIDGEERLRFEAEDDGKQLQKIGLAVKFMRNDMMTEDDGVVELVAEVGKVGKKKRCRVGYRRKVEVAIQRVL